MDPSVIVILTFVILIIIFFITREVWCWYWKINEIVDLLQSIDQKLTANNRFNSGEEESSEDKISFKNIVNENETRVCPFCSETVKNSALVCRFCGKDLKEYDEEMKQKDKEKKAELKEKYKNIHGLLKEDGKIYSEAKELRRIYSKKTAVDYLKKKAYETGINCEEITEDCIDALLDLN